MEQRSFPALEHSAEDHQGKARYWRLKGVLDLSEDLFFFYTGGAVDPFLTFGFGVEVVQYPKDADESGAGNTSLSAAIGVRRGTDSPVQLYLQGQATIWVPWVYLFSGSSGTGGGYGDFAAGLDVSAGLDFRF